MNTILISGLELYIATIEVWARQSHSDYILRSRSYVATIEGWDSDKLEVTRILY